MFKLFSLTFIDQNLYTYLLPSPLLTKNSKLSLKRPFKIYIIQLLKPKNFISKIDPTLVVKSDHRWAIHNYLINYFGHRIYAIRIFGFCRF